MVYKKIALEDLQIDAFEYISKKWFLISASVDGVVNTMTASWGGFGTLWFKNVATIYIRPQRFTKEFVDHSDYFTLTFFEDYKKELSILGSKSGRDGDKIKEVGFDIERIEGQPTFTQGSIVLVCKKLYKDSIKKECFFDESLNDKVYPTHDQHDLYIGEIVAVYQNQ